jgi:hypothetical protein
MRGDWWAWEIHPSMTAHIMGAGCIAGAYFLVRVAITPFLVSLAWLRNRRTDPRRRDRAAARRPRHALELAIRPRERDDVAVAQ